VVRGARVSDGRELKVIYAETRLIALLLTHVSRPVSPIERESYAQISSSEINTDSPLRRRDVFSATDKAFRDNELLVPISGFLSEHGQLYQRDNTRDSPQPNKAKKLLRLPPALKSRQRKNTDSRRGLNHSHHDHLMSDMDSSHAHNLLDIKDVSMLSFYVPFIE